MRKHDFPGILHQIRSSKADVRMAGWGELLMNSLDCDKWLEPANLQKLQKLYMAEKDAQVEAIAGRAIHCVSLALHRESVKKASHSGVGPWLFSSFGCHSALLVITSDNRERRDEFALHFIDRQLPQKEFPAVTLERVLLGTDNVAARFYDGNWGTVGILGRPAMFGPRVRELVEHKTGGKPCSRFRFPLGERPPLKPGAVHRDYHTIEEYRGDQRVNVFRTTVNNDGPVQSRTDYGIVQRHVVDIGGRQMKVVIWAGASSLGTMGAAIWAGTSLFARKGDNHLQYRLPPQTNDDTPLEAFVKVTASETRGVWSPTDIRLERLYLGKWQWSSGVDDWLLASPMQTAVTGFSHGALRRITVDGREFNVTGRRAQVEAVWCALCTAWTLNRSTVTSQEVRDTCHGSPLVDDNAELEHRTLMRNLNNARRTPEFEQLIEIRNNVIIVRGDVQFDAKSPVAGASTAGAGSRGKKR